MRIGRFDGKALEKLLIDRIQKSLFFGEVANHGRRGFDGVIKAVQRLKKPAAAPVRRNQSQDDRFDLAGDDVEVGEIRAVEHLAKQAFGQQVLDQHFFHGLHRNIRIDIVLADGDELVKGRDKACVVGSPFGFDQLQEAVANLVDPAAEFLHRLAPFLELGRFPGEKPAQHPDQVFGPRQVFIRGRPAVLIQNRPLRRLKQNIVPGVPGVEFAADFALQVVVRIFGFPDAVDQVKAVHNRPIEKQILAALIQGVLFHQHPVVLVGAIAQQRRKQRRDRALFLGVAFGLPRQPPQLRVIRLNDLVRGFQVQLCHSVK